MKGIWWLHLGKSSVIRNKLQTPMKYKKIKTVCGVGEREAKIFLEARNELVACLLDCQ